MTKSEDATAQNLSLNRLNDYFQAGGSPRPSEGFLHRAKHVKERYAGVAAPPYEY